jgi:hypothetical protein
MGEGALRKMSPPPSSSQPCGLPLVSSGGGATGGGDGGEMNGRRRRPCRPLADAGAAPYKFMDPKIYFQS